MSQLKTEYLEDGAVTLDKLDPAIAAVITHEVLDTFTLDATDISNKYVVLSEVPDDADLVIVTVKGQGPTFVDDDFEMTTDNGNKRLSWDGLDLEDVLVDGDKIQARYSAT